MLAYFHKMYRGSAESFYEANRRLLETREPRFIVTANPETFMTAQKNADFDRVLRRETTTIVADGIGIVKASKFLGIPAEEKVTGVEIAAHLLEDAGELGKSIYFYGAREDVLQQLVQKVNHDYPGASVVGARNGYDFTDEEVFGDIAEKQPDIVMVALGIPRQELLIDRYFSEFHSGIFIGVGGSFDVLSGSKKRAPEFFVRLNLEWLYRITREPKRLKRFFNSNVRFLFDIRRIKKQMEKNHAD